jgi:hypothetical protein
MADTTPPGGARFDVVGGAIFRRAMRVLDGDQATAAQLAEELFVRFIVHAGGERMDARSRWAWIYRVATVAGVRRLAEGALARRLGLAEGARLDETEEVALMLRSLDGLTAEELTEVLGGTAAVSVGGASDVEAAGHPSALALDRDAAAHAAHVAGCARCRQLTTEGQRWSETFAAGLAPAARARVIAAIRAERARQGRGVRWKRLLWMTGAAAVVAGLALVVARPRKPQRAETPYAEAKGASRAKKSGLQIRLRRGEEVQNLDPFAALRRGDRLHFRVRGERARYLELRVRGPEGTVRVFPDGAGTATAALVTPGQSLDRDYLVPETRAGSRRDAGAGRESPHLWIVALFADRPFALDQPPTADIEIVPVRVDLE